MILYCCIKDCGYCKNNFCNKTVVEINEKGMCSYLSEKIRYAKNFNDLKEKLSKDVEIEPLNNVNIYNVKMKEE